MFFHSVLMVKNKTDLLSAKGAELTNENEAELVGKLSLLSLHAIKQASVRQCSNENFSQVITVT